MPKIHKIFFILILVCTIVVLLAPVKNGFCFNAMASVDINTISKDDSLTLKIIMKGGQGEVDISPITDFKVISGGSSTSISIINGKYSSTYIRTYILFPLKQGLLKIPSLSVSKGSQIVHTKEINIRVIMQNMPVPPSPGITGPQGRGIQGGIQGINPKSTGDIFARAMISSPVLYTGQQAIYTFKFYSAVNYSSASLDEPSFKGFSAKETGKRKKYTLNLNGRLYNVTEINYLLIPEKPGEFNIEPAIVICEVSDQNNGNPFGNFPFGNSFFNNNFFSMGQTKTKRTSSNSLKVIVKPLPPYKGNDNFSGLVGKFSLGAGLDRTELNTGDSATFTITISGTGNIMDAIAPEIHLPKGIKEYDDSPEDKITISSRGYTGSKIFKKALVPVKPGLFTIAPVSLCYFNVQTGKYEIISTPALTMLVHKSNSKQIFISESDKNKIKNNKIIKKRVKFTGHDILDLKEGSDVLKSKPYMSFSMFIILILSPCVIFFIFKGIFILMKKEKSPGVLMEKKSVFNLKQAENKNLSDEDFLKFLYNAILFKVLAKKGISGKSLTGKEACDILSSAGYPEDTANKVSDILSKIEDIRYGGKFSNMNENKNSSNMNLRKDMLNRTKDIFKILCIVLFCFSIFLTIPQNINAMDKSGTLFLKAVKNYQNGNYEEAAKDFKILTENGVKTGGLYYNIGNCYFKAGKTGLAILWYERAKKLIPYDPDLKFNLNYALTRVKDKKDNTSATIADILFSESIVPPIVLQYGAIGLCMVFFLYAGFRTVKKRKIFTPAGILIFSCFIIFTFTALCDFYYKNTIRFAVIIKNKVAVRSGISTDSTKLFVLHSGTKVKVKRINNDYLMIFFSKGKIGWIKKDAAEII